ncbi:MAG: ATP-dependent helicase RhlE [Thermoleophilaceae bacterium]|jgi:superfamily II DNA/RNA helicase|nr:ATP-dependent helicase RhlE [Thermoleophilaceae bacterium]
MNKESFADLDVLPVLNEALVARGIASAFAIQQLVIPDALAGRDVLAQSPTGSGKTLAFAIPMVQRLARHPRRHAGLVLAPTRELALQIVEELEPLAAACDLRVAAVYGGVGFGPQISRARNANVIVACPGRLEDLIARGDVKLDHVEMLVLDEADRMLDMGFAPSVSKIVKRTPSSRQTLLFSATLDGAVGKLADSMTRNPRSHEHRAPRRDAAIEHRFVAVAHEAKLDLLVDELAAADRGRTLVFVRTKRGADRLVKRLRTRGADAVAIHGDKSQSQREKALRRFHAGDTHTLIATDVAARGIDVQSVTHVINFDAPADRDTYVHRIGRTGRAGQTGVGITFFMHDQAADLRRMASELRLHEQFEAA